MHLGNGMVTPGCAVFGLATLGLSVGGAYLLHRAQKWQTPKPMHFALATAAVFAMQTFNVTVIPHASSGHILGAFLLACWFGPLYALFGMAMVLGIQSLLFADGGLAMWGLNTVMMGVIPGVAVYSLVKHFAGKHADKMAVRAAGCWLGTLLAATCCGLALLSREEAREHAGTWMASMLGVHALIGLVEAVITVTMLAAVSKIAKLNWSAAVECVVCCVAMAAVVILASFGASPYPDGLEYSLQRFGIEALPSFGNPFALWPDYNSVVGTLAGGLILLTISAAFIYVLGSVSKKKVSD